MQNFELFLQLTFFLEDLVNFGLLFVAFKFELDLHLLNH